MEHTGALGQREAPWMPLSVIRLVCRRRALLTPPSWLEELDLPELGPPTLFTFLRTAGNYHEFKGE